MHNPTAANAANPSGAVSISPDGKRFALRVIRGEVANNRVCMEVIAGDTASPEAAARLQSIATFYSSGLGPGDNHYLGPQQDLSEDFNRIRWLDNDRIAFLWSDADGVAQVVQVNLVKNEIRYLTRHPTPIGTFDISLSGAVIFNAEARNRGTDKSTRLSRDGFALAPSTDIYRVVRGDFSGTSQVDQAVNTEWLFQPRLNAAPQQIIIGDRLIDPMVFHIAKLSPNGNFALINSAPLRVPDEWDSYGVDSLSTPDRWRDEIREARVTPTSKSARYVQQLYIVDLRDGSTRPLWDAVTGTFGLNVEWSPDEKSILLAPTYLPVSGASHSGLLGQAVAVVDAASGTYDELPIVLPAASETTLRWLGSSIVEIAFPKGGKIQRQLFKRTNLGWRYHTSQADRSTQKQRVRFEVREDLDTPPRLFVRDEVTGKENMLLDANPSLSRSPLGKVEKISGTFDGGEWEGLLFYPPSFDQKAKYPLVIQSVYGSRPDDRFTLYGSQDYGALGPPLIAHYPGRLLSARQVMVLHLNVTKGHKIETAAEGEMRSRAFEAAAKQLAAAGLVDPDRVGLVGFSRNGYYVEYALSHSSFPFAAAIAADNYDPSYVPMTLIGYSKLDTVLNGGSPFGDGLLAWVKSAPGFNAEKINTPLREVVQTEGVFGIIAKWELYSRLRYLRRPVELYVMPDAEHGHHVTQNPQQVAAGLEGTLDWFGFWLLGQEDTDPAKAEQYARWRGLRELQCGNPRARHLFCAGVDRPRPRALEDGSSARLQ